MGFKNKVTVAGRICKDIKILLDVNKQPYCYLLVSVPRDPPLTDKQSADNISVRFKGFNELQKSYAETVAKQFKKDDFIEVEGAWRTESFTKNGQTVWTHFVEPKTIQKLKPEAVSS